MILPDKLEAHYRYALSAPFKLRISFGTRNLDSTSSARLESTTGFVCMQSGCAWSGARTLVELASPGLNSAARLAKVAAAEELAIVHLVALPLRSMLLY